MKNLRRGAAVILGCLAAVYALAYADLTLRARSAYLEGEKYLLWSQKPEIKKAYYDGLLNRETGELENEYQNGKITKDNLEQKIELARIRHDRAISESSLKYAYVWFETGATLFSPPQNRWTRRCRAQMTVAKALWEKELDAEKIPYKDYMLE